MHGCCYHYTYSTSLSEKDPASSFNEKYGSPNRYKLQNFLPLLGFFIFISIYLFDSQKKFLLSKTILYITLFFLISMNTIYKILYKLLSIVLKMFHNLFLLSSLLPLKQMTTLQRDIPLI